MITNTATFGQGTAIHGLNEQGHAICGAGVSRAAGTGTTKVTAPTIVTGAMTCKRCLKFAAGQPVIPSKKAQHLAAPAPVALTNAWCHICDTDLQGTGAEIQHHVRNCKG